MKHTIMIFVAALVVFISQSFLMAQTNTFPPTGNVGIGTTAPQRTLHIVNGGICMEQETLPPGLFGWQVAPGGSGDNSFLGFHEDTLPNHDGIWRMVINKGGNVGIGTTSPGSRLTVSGMIESTSGGIKFPDGTLQSTAQLKGPQGPQGPKGEPGPPIHSVAVCQSGAPVSCACEGRTITKVSGTCSITSDTGPCSNTGPGCCAVCAP